MSRFIFTITTFLIALILHASTAVISRETSPCNFFMAATGGLNGTISQDAVGEPRFGGTFPQASFFIAHGTLTDRLNHTCLISSTTHQLQCTQGVAGSGFKFSDNFLVLHDETNANWLACPAPGPGQDGSYNIYSSQKADSTGCLVIKLQAESFGCAAQGRPDSSTTGIATSAIASSASKTNDVSITSASIPTSRIATTAARSMPSLSAICPTDISSGIFQFPHLIVPTSPKSPDTAFGNSFKASISPINSTLFNFDIPTTAPYTGFCSLIFLFPYAQNLILRRVHTTFRESRRKRARMEGWTSHASQELHLPA
ncbi:hypothetical protein LSUB1_G001367 [Lachnellula subtilissima]|uniref:Ubiquitin 3 binding protein But2 C-terminal domain-containing protein n=1 Tax=Lachnellula subtilissima TaxID=602034 RepID=A0A8H8UDU9_9HELO|nr:hypothetical protein LSUB1_G001367 [Lachnellula subtilissima]